MKRYAVIKKIDGMASSASVCREFDNIDDALVKGLEQNQDFFSLLLNNEEIKKEVLGIFTEEIYKSLRGEK